MVTEPDAAFADPRLAALYDVFEDERADLDVYVAIAEEFGARAVVDVGCGTGELAVRLARRGLDVIGVDPATASLDVARRKSGADRVRWVDGDATALLEEPVEELIGHRVDLVVMTGNVAQVFVDDDDWRKTLDAITRTLRPGGRLVFETRRIEARAWETWTEQLPPDRREVDGRIVESRFELLDVRGDRPDGVADRSSGTAVEPLTVTFRFTYGFEPGSATEPGDETWEISTSTSTLRFRSLPEIERDLAAAGLGVVEVRDAPDRPGLEWVVVAERLDEPSLG